MHAYMYDAKTVVNSGAHISGIELKESLSRSGLPVLETATPDGKPASETIPG